MLQKLKTGICCAALCLTITAQIHAAEPAVDESSAFDPKADEVLRSMDTYLRNQDSIKIDAESLLDIVTDQGEVITYTRQNKLSIRKPDKMYAKRTGALRNQEFFYNGKELALHSIKHNVYAVENMPPTINEMLDFSTKNFNLRAPGSDFLYSDIYNGMMSAATSGSYMGKVLVDGVECHHLAYRTEKADFQLWIQTGKEAKPKRYMIISKLRDAAPRYIFTIASMEAATFPDATFEFDPGEGEHRITLLSQEEIEQLKQADKESK